MILQMHAGLVFEAAVHLHDWQEVMSILVAVETMEGEKNTYCASAYRRLIIALAKGLRKFVAVFCSLTT
jgi:hypothetical protein